MGDSIVTSKFILFGGDHYNTLEALRSLSFANMSPTIVLKTNGYTPYLVKSSRFAKYYYEVQDYPEALDFVRNRFDDGISKLFLIPCDDESAEFLDKQSQEFGNNICAMGGGNSLNVKALFNKQNINVLAKEKGLIVPKSTIIKKGDLPNDLGYPIITKPLKSVDGGGKSDIKVCRNEDELLKAYEVIKSDVLLIEEYVEKEKEFSVEGFSIKNGQEIYIPFSVQSERALDGVYGNYLLIEPFKDENLNSKIQDIIRAAGYNGVFSVDFLLDKQHSLVFLEVNFRHSAFSFVGIYGGINLLEEWINATLIEQIDREKLNEQIIKGSFHAMVEPRDFCQFVVTRKISLFHWLKDLFKSEVLFFYQFKDPYPALAEWFHMVKMHFTKT